MNISQLLQASIIGSMFLTIGVQAATFATPKNYSIIVVDGKKTTSMFSSTNKIELKPGQHQVLVQFKGTFKKGKDQLLVSASDPIVINLPNVDSDDNYTFSFARITSYDQAQDYSSKQSINLTLDGATAEKDKASYFILKSEKGFQLDRDYIEDLKSLNLLYVSPENAEQYKTDNTSIDNCRNSGFTNCPTTVVAGSAASTIASQNKALTVTAQVAPQATPTAPVASPTTTAKSYDASKVNLQILDGLKTFYNTADPDTKEAFKAWVNAQ